MTHISMTKATQVAVITGGTSGIGLAVGKALAERSGWKVYLIGTNEKRGQNAIQQIPRSSFCKVDVKDYDSLAATFNSIFTENGRLDFVFANAGVTGISFNIYDQLPEDGIPPKPTLEAVDINFNSVVWTSYLALHYFRQSPRDGERQRNLIITGSCTSFYRSGAVPVYTATKHALVGFTRSIARRFQQEGIRVNLIGPGIVRTNFGSEELWKKTPPEVIIPMEHLVNVTLLLMSGEDVVDSLGVRIPGPEVFGRTVEITTTNYYFREQPDWSDDSMTKTMTKTSLSG